MYKIILAIFVTVLISSRILFAQVTSLNVTINQPGNQGETAIASNPGDPTKMMIGYNYYQFPNDLTKSCTPGFAFSSDGGVNWATGDRPPSGFTYGFDPSVGYDKRNHAILCLVAKHQASGLGRTYVSFTSDQGGLWKDEPVSTSTDRCDKPAMAIDNGVYDGRVYIAWREASQGLEQIKFRISL